MRVWGAFGIGGGWRISSIGGSPSISGVSRRRLSISGVYRCYLLRGRSAVISRGSTGILHWHLLLQRLLDHGLRGVDLVLRNDGGIQVHTLTGREKVNLVNGISPHTLVTAGVLDYCHDEYEDGIWHNFNTLGLTLEGCKSYKIYSRMSQLSQANASTAQNSPQLIVCLSAIPL